MTLRVRYGIATAIAMTLCVLAWAIPYCPYEDPVFSDCKRYVGANLIESVTITCRMLEVVPNGVPSGMSSSCSYYYCDLVACPTDSTQKARKLRTKTVERNNNTSATCRQWYMVTDTSDQAANCCNCVMKEVAWP